jgi:hypothetical protein
LHGRQACDCGRMAGRGDCGRMKQTNLADSCTKYSQAMPLEMHALGWSIRKQRMFLGCT